MAAQGADLAGMGAVPVAPGALLQVSEGLEGERLAIQETGGMAEPFSVAAWGLQGLVAEAAAADFRGREVRVEAAWDSTEKAQTGLAERLEIRDRVVAGELQAPSSMAVFTGVVEAAPILQALLHAAQSG